MTPDEERRFSQLYPKEFMRRFRIIQGNIRAFERNMALFRRILGPEADRIADVAWRNINIPLKHRLRVRRNILRRKGVRTKSGLIGAIETEAKI